MYTLYNTKIRFNKKILVRINFVKCRFPVKIPVKELIIRAPGISIICDVCSKPVIRFPPP